MQNSCHFGEYEGAGTVICKYRYILGKYNQRVKSKGNDKKVHGPTTTLAGIARRGVFVRPGRCSCLQVSKKKTKTGTTFLTACSLYYIHIIALATSHSVFRSPYNTVEGKFKGGQASSVFILKLFSYNSRLERIPSVIRKSDLRLTPILRGVCAPKNPDKSICYQTVINFNSRNSIVSKFQEPRDQYKEHRW